MKTYKQYLGQNCFVVSTSRLKSSVPTFDHTRAPLPLPPLLNALARWSQGHMEQPTPALWCIENCSSWHDCSMRIAPCLPQGCSLHRWALSMMEYVPLISDAALIVREGEVGGWRSNPLR
eukprot:698124-Pelagomonas_calceolata.AAC.1